MAGVGAGTLERMSLHTTRLGQVLAHEAHTGGEVHDALQADPLDKYRLGTIVSKTTTSRRQGLVREGVAEGSRSAKERGDGLQTA